LTRLAQPLHRTGCLRTLLLWPIQLRPLICHR
jgi:hypothetical protein